MVQEFGPGVIQTPQSPMGQLNGLFADLAAEIDERMLSLYQAYDPLQAEGEALDLLGRIRALSRAGRSDAAFRTAITNTGRPRIDVQDIREAILSLDGVTYCNVTVNETAEVDVPEMDRAHIAIAVIGGADDDIAATIRGYVLPGVSTYGNAYVENTINGRARCFAIIRPITVPVTLSVQVRRSTDDRVCPSPSTDAIRDQIVSGWADRRDNGLDVSFYQIRTLVERANTDVEVVNVTGARDGITYATNQTVPIGLIEIASLMSASVTVTEA